MMNISNEIKVESLEAWAKEFKDQGKWGECLVRMPDNMLEEYKDVINGRKVLKTPDGRKWYVPVSGSVGEMRVSGDVGRVLVDYVIDHATAAGHMNISLPELLFDQETLHPSYVFCMVCMRFVDVAKDASVYDGLENRGWED